MSFEGLAPVTDVRAGAWIAARLCGSVVASAASSRQGSPADARVLHPAADERDRLASWAQVCQLTGRIAHPLMQWHTISTAPPTDSPAGAVSWPGSDPKVGNLPPAMLASVLEVLAGFTADPGDCYHAVWEGWGWRHGDGTIGTFFPSDSSDPRRFCPPQPAPPGLPQEVLDGPRLSHPHRDYLLFHGPLRAALSIGHQVTADWRLPQSPSLLWPADKSWLLATEIDFDSTLVGGSTQLVQELLQATPLEAWPVGIGDDLTIDGDRINL